jgi:hypothetical protein
VKPEDPLISEKGVELEKQAVNLNYFKQRHGKDITSSLKTSSLKLISEKAIDFRHYYVLEPDNLDKVDISMKKRASSLYQEDT